VAAQPLVSCIIPAYNAADTIAQAIESVRRQTYPHVEVVVVDDGSTDGTDEVVWSRFQDVTYVKHAQNGGPAAARNSGARVARGAVLALLDADDEWLPVKTEIQLDALERMPNAGVLFTGLVLRARKWGSRVFPLRLRAGLRHFTARDILWGSRTPVSPASAMMYASTFAALGGFDERADILEEELWVRMAGCGLSLARLELPLYVQHVTAGSVTSDVRWMTNARLATLQLCAPDALHGRAIGMSPDEYGRLWRKSLTTGALSLVRAAQFGEAHTRLAHGPAADGRRRYRRALLFLVTRWPSLLRIMVRAAWLPGRLLHYIRTRATYCRYARLLETHPTDARQLERAFSRHSPARTD